MWPWGRGGGSNRQTNVKPRQTTSKSSGGRCFALLLRALSCLGCSLLSQPLSCTCTCTSVPLCSLLPALWCYAIPASSSSLAGETTAKRHGGRCFCERSVLCPTSTHTLFSHDSDIVSLREITAKSDGDGGRCHGFVVPLQAFFFVNHISRVNLCLSVESVPYPHSVLSSFLNLLYVRPRQRTAAVVVVLLCFASIVLHCSLRLHMHSESRLACMYLWLCLSVPLTTSLLYAPLCLCDTLGTALGTWFSQT